MSFPWLELLPEMRDECRARFDPLCDARFAMTCTEEAARRWTRYLTRFSGARALDSFRRAQCEWDSDEGLSLALDLDASYPLSRAALYKYKRDAAVLMNIQRIGHVRQEHMPLTFDFNTREAALRFLTLSTGAPGNADHVHTRAYWDVIEGVVDAVVPLACAVMLVHWAMRNSDLRVLRAARSKLRGERIWHPGTDV